MKEILTGYHAIEERLNSGDTDATLFFARKNPRVERLIDAARNRGVKAVSQSTAELDILCGHRDHHGLVLVVSASKSPSQALTLASFLSSITAETALVLVLSGVTDPQNLGAILRSADQFQADMVILPQRRSAHESDAVARASAGASAHVPSLVVPNLARALADLKEAGFWIYGADARGDRADTTKLSGRVALVLGSEGSGIPRLVEESCDVLLRIPAAGRVDSFNVSVAAGILLYEVRRQQGFPFRESEA